MPTETEAPVHCPKCGYEWEKRVPYPRKCPNPECQTRYPLGKPNNGRG